MATTQAWTGLLQLYTDGSSVWAMRGEQLLATRVIGPGADGPEVEVMDTAVEVVRAALGDDEALQVAGLTLEAVR